MHKITFAYTLPHYELHIVTHALQRRLEDADVSATAVRFRPDDRDVVVEVLGQMGIEYETTVPKKSSRSVRPVGATRKDLLSRNYGLCYLCNNEPSSELHHVIHRENRGSNHWRNLAPLCRRCHRFIHQHQRKWDGYDGSHSLKEEFGILLMPIERTYCVNQQYLHHRWQWVRSIEDRRGSKMLTELESQC